MLCCVVAAQTAPPEQRQLYPNWGRFFPATNAEGTFKLEVARWPADGRFVLPARIGHITAAYEPAITNIALQWSLGSNYIQLSSRGAPLPGKTQVLLDTGPTTVQFPRGRIVFPAESAKLAGSHLKLEDSQEGQRISGWSEAPDGASWDFKPTRWGKYDVDITYSSEGEGESEFELLLPGQTFHVALSSSGGNGHYYTVSAGRYYLAKADPASIQIQPVKIAAGTAVTIKAITLRPAPEGDPIIQTPEGEVVLKASQATTRSTTMRYEPASVKNCLGYWVNPEDWADWQFSIERAGSYDIEVWQGCGKDQGGSEV